MPTRQRANALLADNSLADRGDWILILIHAAEIGVWALFFMWAGCLPDAESAFYFSGVTCATVATAMSRCRNRGVFSDGSRA
jgi:hypothetical protein